MEKFKSRLAQVYPYGILGSILTVIYFLTRLVNLTVIPIFTDEAIYLRWGQIADVDPRWRFISLIDGKQPLLIWLFLPAFKFISDPLVAGRIVSVIAGFCGLLGLAVLSLLLLRSKKAVALAGSLYILLPFFYVYDRLAIYDALMTTIGIWALLFTYLLGKTLRLDVALILGTIIGAGLLTKSYALYYLMLLPASLLIVSWSKSKRLAQVFKWLGLVLVVFVQSQIYHGILLLSEFRHLIALKNYQFIYTLAELKKAPLAHLGGNLTGLSIWLVTYLTWPLTLLILVAVVWQLKNKWREGLFFLSYFLIPFLSLAVFGKVIYPRFILFMVPPLLVFTIIFCHWLLIQKKLSRASLGLFFLVSLPLVNFEYKLATDPIHAPLPLADRQQFINDWPAGYGINQVVAYLEEEAKNGPLVVGTDGTFGLFPMALELYLGTNPNVKFKPYWPLNEFPQELIESAQTKPTFLVFKEKQEYPGDWPIKLIAQYQRGDGPTYLKFFRVVPKS